jgi:adenylyl-sulfate kinase
MPKSSPEPDSGFVVWMEGFPGAGKSTLSKSVASALADRGWPVEVLDGEDVRAQFFPELGYTRKDRETHARRVSTLAKTLARHGVIVLVAMITPYETSRQAARATVGTRFAEVWLECPIDICRKRDPRGWYQKTREGKVKRFTGVDDPFEEPLSPDLVVDTSEKSVSACTQQVLKFLESRGVGPGGPS